MVGLPVFLEGPLGWSFYQVGGFLACWVIGYGIVQFSAPALLRRFGSGQPPQAKTIQFWTFTLTVVPAAIAIALQSGAPPNVVIVVGLAVFGLVFAFNSAVHSYLVLAFTDDDKSRAERGLLLHGKFWRSTGGYGAFGSGLSILWVGGLPVGVHGAGVGGRCHFHQAAESTTQ